jgi:hypothetical protein
MAELWVNYRYEYVSGGFPLLGQVDYKLMILVVNRGGTEGIAQGYVSRFGDSVVSDLTVYDSGEMSVPPGGSVTAIVPSLEQDECYWARIFTTSQNLVPSVQVFQDTTPLSPGIYYAPGDFSEFALPYRPVPIPPVGPLESA